MQIYQKSDKNRPFLRSLAKALALGYNLPVSGA
jgi:hypothetical protein